VEQQRDAPLASQEQQSTILNVTVAAQHPQYAMTALALGDQQMWVNRLDRPQGESARIRIQASDVSCCSPLSKPVSAIFCPPGHAVY
jgi:ABC-type molybdate transport system ATPase subunit